MTLGVCSSCDKKNDLNKRGWCLFCESCQKYGIDHHSFTPTEPTIFHYEFGFLKGAIEMLAIRLESIDKKLDKLILKNNGEKMSDYIASGYHRIFEQQQLLTKKYEILLGFTQGISVRKKLFSERELNEMSVHATIDLAQETLKEIEEVK